MGVTPSKEEDAPEEQKTNRGADATASLSEDENLLTAPETLGRKKKKGSVTSPLRKNGVRAQMNEEAASAEAMSHISSQIFDDQVNVNLAMADLMAYLQVVATNSQNIPTTRRDNPELRKSEDSLTADEYARKSAAFIPADVRVIAGSFSKYGRVWDLPTIEVCLRCLAL